MDGSPRRLPLRHGAGAHIDVPCTYLGSFAHLLRVDPFRGRCTIRVFPNVVPPARTLQPLDNNQDSVILEVPSRGIRLLACSKQTRIAPDNRLLANVEIAGPGHPLVAKESLKYPEFSSWITQAAECKRAVLELQSTETPYWRRGVSQENIKQRAYLELLGIPYHHYTEYKVGNVKAEDRYRWATTSSICDSKYHRFVLNAYHATIRMYSAILAAFTEQKGLGDVCEKMLLDAHNNTCKSQYINRELAFECIETSRSALAKINCLMDGGGVRSVNGVNCTVIQVLIIKLQVIPLLVSIKADLMCRKLDSFSYDEAQRVIGNIFCGAWYEVCSVITADLNDLIFYKQSALGSTIYDEVIGLDDYINDKALLNDSPFAKYVPTIHVMGAMTSDEIADLRTQIELWHATLRLFYFIFGYFGTSYVGGINYADVSHTDTIIVYRKQCFSMGSDAAARAVEFAASASENENLAGLCYQLCGAGDYYKIYDPFTIGELDTRFEEFESSVSDIVQTIEDIMLPNALETELYELLYNDCGYNNIRYVAMTEMARAVTTPEDVDGCNIFNMCDKKMEIDYKRIKVVINQTRDRAREIRRLEATKLFALMMRIDLAGISSNYLREHDKLISKLGSAVEKTLIGFSNVCQYEVNSLRDIVLCWTGSSVNFQLGPYIERKVRVCAKTAINCIEQAAVVNGLRYLEIFEAGTSKRHIDDYFTKLYEPIVGIYSLVGLINRTILDISTKHQEIANILSFVDARVQGTAQECESMLTRLLGTPPDDYTSADKPELAADGHNILGMHQLQCEPWLKTIFQRSLPTLSIPTLIGHKPFIVALFTLSCVVEWCSTVVAALEQWATWLPRGDAAPIASAAIVARLLSVVLPLNDALVGFARVEVAMDKELDAPLRAFPAKDLARLAERAVRAATRLASEGAQRSGGEKLACHESHTSRFRIIVEKAPDYLGILAVLCLLTDGDLSEEHLGGISAVIGDVDWERVHTGHIIEKVHNKDAQRQLLLLLALYKRNTRAERKAREALEQVTGEMEQIRIYSLFRTSTATKYNSKLVRSIQNPHGSRGHRTTVEADMNYINLAIVEPVDVGAICSQGLAIIGKIFNGVGLQDGDHLSDDSECAMALDVAVWLLEKECDENGVPEELRRALTYEDGYSHYVEMWCRELEATLSMVSAIHTILKRMPIMLKDIVITYINSSIIEYRNNVVNISVNCFSDEEEDLLLATCYRWQYIVERFLYAPEMRQLAELASDEEFIEELMETFQLAKKLHEGLQSSWYTHVLDTYGAKYDPSGTKVERTMPHTYVLAYENQRFTTDTPISVIPARFTGESGRRIYPTALLIDGVPEHVVYSQYPSPLFNSKALFAVMQGITEIQTSCDNGNCYINGVCSGSETIHIIGNEVRPQRNLEVLDDVHPHIKQALTELSFQLWDFFSLQISAAKMRTLNQNASPILKFASGNMYVPVNKYVTTQTVAAASAGGCTVGETVAPSVFVEFFDKSMYQTFYLVICTYCAKQYEKITSLILELAGVDTEMQEVMYFFEQMSEALDKSIKPSCYKRAAMARICEWRRVFDRLERWYQMKQPHRHQDRLPNYNFAHLNYIKNCIEVTDLRESFNVQTGDHWEGEADDLEGDTLTEVQVDKLCQILQGFNQNQVVFALGEKERGYNNREFEVILRQLSRQLMKNVYHLYFTKVNFAREYQKLETCIVCGMICVCYGIEYLAEEEIEELADLAFMMSWHKGSFKTLASPQREEVTSVSSSLAHKLITVDYTNYKDCHTSGYCIFFSPIIEAVEEGGEVTYSRSEAREYKYGQYVPDTQPREASTGEFNVSHEYQVTFEQPVLIKAINKQFQNQVTVIIDAEQALKEFTDGNELFGSYLYEINLVLQTFNNRFCELLPQAGKSINCKARHTSSAQCVALLVFDHIIRQCLFFIDDDHNNYKTCRVLAGVVSACFGLDIRTTQSIMNYADQYCQEVENIIHKYNVRCAGSQMRKPKTNYEKFFTEWLRPALSEDYCGEVLHCMHVYQFSVQMTLDIFNVKELLETRQPMLLISVSESYLRIFVNYLCEFMQCRLFYITNVTEFEMAKSTIVAQSPKSVLLVVSPGSKESYLNIAGLLFEYFKKEAKSQVNLILALNPLVRSQIEEDEFLSLFRLKYLIVPSFENSIPAKRLFLGCLHIDAPSVLRNSHLWSLQQRIRWNTEGKTDITTLFRTLCDHDSIINQAIGECDTLAMHKAISLNSFLFGSVEIIYDIVGKIFDIGTAYEDILFWRSATMFFLAKFGVIEPIPRDINARRLSSTFTDIETLQREYEIHNSSAGYDPIFRSLLADYFVMQHVPLSTTTQGADSMSFERLFLCTLADADTNMAGFVGRDLKRLADQFHACARQHKDSPEVALEEFQTWYATEEIDLSGFGCQNMIEYQFTREFLSSMFLRHSNIKEAYFNAVVPFVISMFNSGQLYYATVQHRSDGSQAQNASLMRELNEKYFAFVREVNYIRKITVFELENMNLCTALIAHQTEMYPNMDGEFISRLTLKTHEEAARDHCLTEEEQCSVIRGLFADVAAMLPRCYIDKLYNYLEYEWGAKNCGQEGCVPSHTVYFAAYEVGKGVMHNIVEEDDLEILSKDLRRTEEKKDPLAGKYTGALSIQKCGSQKLYVDNHRAAICTMLACCMEAPVTVCLVGGEKMGKTELIRIAAMMVRDTVDYNMVTIQDSSSEYISVAMREAVTSKTQIENGEEGPVLRYYQTIAFPHVHIHASSVTGMVVHDDLYELLRNEFVRVKHTESFMCTRRESVAGVLPIQDTSFVVECHESSIFRQISTIDIEVPPLTERFVEKVLKENFPDLSDSWINKFTNGYFILKLNIRSAFLHSFEAINKIIECRSITINRTEHYDRAQLESIERQEQEYSAAGNTVQLEGCSARQLVQFIYNSYGPTILEQIKLQQDSKLYNISVWSVFYVFRNNLNEKLNRQLREKLPTLTIMGDTGISDGATPWCDYQDVQNNNIVVPAWQAYAINRSYEHERLAETNLARVSSDVQIHNLPVLHNIRYLEPKYDGNHFSVATSVNSEDSLISLGLYSENSYFFARYMLIVEMYKHTLDPYVMNLVFELYTTIETERARNASKLSTMVSTGLPRCSSTLTGIYAQDDMCEVKDKIIRAIRGEDTASCREAIHGFSLSGVLSLETPRASIFVQNANSEQYNKIVASLSTLGCYDDVLLCSTALEECEEPEKIGKERKKRLVFDIDRIVEAVELAPEGGAPDKEDANSITTMISNILERYAHDSTYNKKELDFICLLYILRVSACLALGVQPHFIFNATESATPVPSLGWNIASQLISNYSYRMAPGGSSAQIFPFIPVNGHTQNMEDGGCTNMPSVNPVEVLVIGTKARFDAASNTGASLYELLTGLLDPMSIMPNIFTQEEQQAICMIVCCNLGIKTVLDWRAVGTFLSANYSVVVVDTGERQQELLNTCLLGAAQEPLAQVHNMTQRLLNDIFYNGILAESSGSYGMAVGHALTQVSIREAALSQVSATAMLSSLNYPTKIVNNLSISNEMQTHSEIAAERIHLMLLKPRSDDNATIIVISYEIFKYMSSLREEPICSYERYQSLIFWLYMVFIKRCSTFEETYLRVRELLESQNELCQITQEEVKILDLQKLSVPYVIRIVNEIQYKTEQVLGSEGFTLTDEQKNAELAVGEAIVLRDSYATILSFLESEREIFQKKLNTLALDCICCATYLLFIQPGMISDERTLDLISSGELGEVDIVMKSIEQQILNHNSTFNIFNFLVISVIQLCGIKAGLPYKYMIHHNLDGLVSEEQLRMENYREICAHTKVYGKEMFLTNYLELCAIDTAAFMLAGYYKLSYQHGDPYIQILDSVALCSHAGYTNYIVNREAAMACAYLIASLGEDMYEHTMEALDLQDDLKNTQCEKLIDRYSRRVFFIDMCGAIEAQLKITRAALTTERPIIVLYNVGVTGQNRVFFDAIRQLLVQKCSRTAKHTKRIKFGTEDVALATPIHDINIIFGCYHDHNPVTNAGLDGFEQEVVDELAVITVPLHTIEEQSSWGYSNIEWKIHQSIFGDQQGPRCFSELTKLLHIQAVHTYSDMHSITVKLCKRIRDMNLNLSDKDQLYTSCVQASMLRGPEKALFEDLFKYASMIRVSEAISELMYSKDSIPAYNRPLYLRCLNFQLIRKLKQQILDHLVKAVYYSMELFNRLSDYELTAFALSEDDSIRFICENIARYCGTVAKQHIEEMEHTFKLSNKGLAYFAQVYPITSYINQNTDSFKNNIIRIVIQSILSRAVPMFKPDYVYAVYLLVTNIFLVVCGYTNMSTTEDYRNYRSNMRDIQIIPQVLSSDFEDECKILTVASISSAFLESSVSIDMYLTKKQREATQYKRVHYLQPEICRISKLLQLYWMNIMFIERFNKLCSQQASWYIKNNSSFVRLAELDNLYYAFLRGYYHKDEGCFNYLDKKNRSVQFMDEIILDSHVVNKYAQLPPQVEKLDSGGNFSVFAESVALEPEYLMENMQIYGTIIQNIAVHPPQVYNDVYQTSVQRSVSGIVGPNMQEREQLSIQQICDIVLPSFTMTLRLFTDSVGSFKVGSELVSNSVMQLCNIVYLSKQCAEAAHNVTIIYYDQCVHITQLLEYCYNIMPPSKKGEKLVFSRYVNGEQLHNYSVALLIDPSTNGKDMIGRLEAVVDWKTSKYKNVALNPLYILIPSCVYTDILEAPICNGAITVDFRTQRQFRTAVKQLMLKVSPTICYIAKPETIASSVTHVFNLVVCLAESNPQVGACISSGSVRRIVSLRGLVLFCLQYGFLMLEETLEYNDRNVALRIKELLNLEANITQNMSLINDAAPFNVRSSNDFQLVYNSVAAGFGERRLQELIKTLNFSRDADIGCLMFGVSVYAVSRKNTISKGWDTTECMEEESSESSSNSEEGDADGIVEGSESDTMAEASISMETSRSTLGTYSRLEDTDAGRQHMQARHPANNIEDVYGGYIQRMIKVGNGLVSRVQASSIQTDITRICDSHHRRIVYFGTPNLHAIEKEGSRDCYETDRDYYNAPPDEPRLSAVLRIGCMDGFAQFCLFLREMKKISAYMAPNVFDKQFSIFSRNLLRRSFAQVPVEERIRQLISSNPVKDITKQIYHNNPLAERKDMLRDIRQISALMPDQLRAYTRMLEYYTSKQYLLDLRHSIMDEELFRGMYHKRATPREQGYDTNYPFFAYGQVWVVDGNLTVGILGSLFQFMKVMEAIKTGTPIADERIVVTTQRPHGQVVVAPNGEILYNELDEAHLCLEVRNMALYGICYDKRLETVCDATHTAMLGYQDKITLYASVATLNSSNNDYHDGTLGPGMRLLVSDKYVPVKMLIGGICRPYVFLENKTDMCSDQFMAKNPHFAVKII